MKKVEKTALILLVGPDIRLLEATLLHYLGLGLRRILLSVHVYEKKAEQNLSKIRSIAERYHAEVADIHTARGIESAKRYKRLIQSSCAQEDWIVYAHMDEFIQFPAPVTDNIEFCEAEKFDYIQGFFLDRMGQKEISRRYQNSQFGINSL